MNNNIKRLLAIVVGVGVTAVCSTPPSFGQRAPATPEQREIRSQQIKSRLEATAKAHPKWRMLITFRDGTQAAGRIREVREKDFVLRQDPGFPDRTIAFDEIDLRPQKITPKAEKIAEYTGKAAAIVIFFPLIILMSFTFWWD